MNYHFIEDALKDEPDADVELEVLDWLDEFLADPAGQVARSTYLGERNGVDRFVAWLPHSYALSYSLFPEIGPAMLVGPNICARWFGGWRNWE